MKSVKEIRSEANMLYTKSSHYIVANIHCCWCDHGFCFISDVCIGCSI